MEFPIERKVNLIHAIYGLFVGAVFAFTIAKTYTFVQLLLVGFIISYPMMLATRKIFHLSEKEFQLKDWLAKGFFYFLLVMMITWVMVYNLFVYTPPLP